MNDDANDSVSGNSTNVDWKPMRSRSFLTDAQVDILNEQFKRNSFPSKYELSALAECISVNKRVVQVWFQNARAKQKRAAAASNRLIAISDRLSQKAWKDYHNISTNDSFLSNTLLNNSASENISQTVSSINEFLNKEVVLKEDFKTEVFYNNFYYLNFYD